MAAAQRARLAPGPDSALTTTERRIAGLVAAVQANPEIAAALFAGEWTVQSHLNSTYAKQGVESKLDLARRGAELGLS